ncbi:CDC42 small effector 2 [Brachionus plicatilis]|uniref:CDC42 small effector 2 n=1 Tax=Brachionus plicatilis TaxID=10195 RepID=A0A3M7RXQ4_BRAPC|nr:CDC42 small effector 2 [Brachionus plicatilis]
MSDHLLCCFYFNRDSSQQQHNRKFTIRNIDKSMIGLPTNFQHCAHIGCSDIISNALPITNAFDSQLPEKSVLARQQSGAQQPLVAHLKLIDLNVS